MSAPTLDRPTLGGVLPPEKWACNTPGGYGSDPRDYVGEALNDRIAEQIDLDPDDPEEHMLWMECDDDARLDMVMRWLLEWFVGPPPSKAHRPGHTCSGRAPRGLVELDWRRLCCNPDHLVWVESPAGPLWVDQGQELYSDL